MQIQVTEPYCHQLIELNAMPGMMNGLNGWRICFPHKFAFFITQRNGQWRVMDDLNIHPELLDEIGKALHPLALANCFYLRHP